MVGATMAMIMNSSSKDRLDVLADSAKSAMAIPSKLDSLRRLNEILMQEDGDGGSLSGFLPRLFDLQSDQHSPVRKFVAQIIGEIGLRHVEFVPEIVPVLMSVLEDSTPAVARQAISCAISLFRSTLEKISIQGFYTSELDDTLKSSWSSVLELKEKIYSVAFQPGSSGVRLLALKFVETVILLYTPDPNGSLEPPPPHEGKIAEFNISWLRGGHPVLNVGDLAIEASKRLGLLLDQLRTPAVKSLSNLVIIVLINSLATIAKKRPPYYGRILPVLLGLGATSSVIEGKYASGTYHALKNAFLTCLNCTHPGAAPWRDRLVGALREMQAEGLAQEALHQTFKSNGIVEEGKDDLLIAKEEKPLSKTGDGISNKLGRKRFELEHSSDLAEDEGLSGKRVRKTPSDSEESSKDSNIKITVSTDDSPSDGPATNMRTEDNGPVQQLVAMFGALIAQGEKAIGSLDILISSISSDLLAEVVMANMRYLPTCPPQAEGDDESLLNVTMVAKYPSSFLAGVLSLSSSFPPIASQLNAHCSISSDISKSQEEEEVQVAAIADSTVMYAGLIHGANTEMLSSGLPASLNASLSGVEIDASPIPSDYHDIANLEHEIPGLDSSACSGGFPETIGSTDLEDASQDQGTISGGRPVQDVLPSVLTDRSEELSPKSAVMDSNSLISSTATSLDLPLTSVLPKMTAPVVDLADEQKDQLQNLAFVRILEAYKQVAVAGGSQVRFSLLADLGVELPSELDPWKLLQKHVLADYVTNEGHELTLRVLYRLFREVEEERDFFSSTTAASVYEAFLLTVAETLRDSFPPSDKSLSKLLGEAPYLPKPVLSLLESLCCPGNSDKAEKELQSGDRVTQGLSAVWNLILLRPPIREDCLRIALQSAVHHLQEVRMKAIRLVANKLYPLSSISQQIEDFAKEMLLYVATGDGEGMDVEESISDLQKGSNFDKPSNQHPSVSGSKDISSDTPQSVTSQTVSSQSIPDAQRCMALYFALCTKKHSLFRQIFAVYNSTSSAVKQAVHRHVPILVRTMGLSLELLEIISDPPSGSENLLMQVLQTLIEGTVPSPELISTIKKLYDSRLKDADILIPILPFLPRDEVLLIFPNLVNLPPEKFQVALARILKGSSHSGPVLSPSEVLIAIHGIDPDRDGIPLKKVTDACNACFEQRQIFTQPVLAKVLNQLVEQIPLPLLFMRTVLQTIGAFPGLVEFIIEILSRLVSKQIWKYPKLWVGFLKCAFLTKDQSCGVLLQLPPQQLENALTRNAALKEPLTDYAKKPNVKSSLPRSVLAVLGLAPDVHSSSQAQSSVQTSFSAQTSQIQSSPARMQSSPAPISQEQSSLAQTIQRHSSPAQTSQGLSSPGQTSQGLLSPAQRSGGLSSPAQTSQGQSTQADTGDTSNSDKDVATEKSKESSVPS